MKLATLLKPLLDEIEVQQPQSRLDATKRARKPRRPKRKLGVRYPTAYALQYKRYLTDYIRGLKKELDAWVKNDLRPALERHQLTRGDSVRYDAVEDIEQKLDDLMERFGGVLAEEAIKQYVAGNSRQILEYAQRGWQRTIHTITGVDPLVRDLPMQEIVKAHVRQNVSLIKSIPQKFHGDVEREVLSGVRAGRKIPEITQAIQGVYPVTAKRAGGIARDQAGSLNAAIVDEQYKQAQLTTYIWRNMKDRRVRGNPIGKYPHAKYNHWVREGKVYTPDDPPPDGNPGEPIECRCYRQVQEAEVLGKTDEMVQPGEYYEEPPKAVVEERKPTMSRKEADTWVKNSVYQDDVYHGTLSTKAEMIRKEGFRLDAQANGRLYGDGVYVAQAQKDAAAFAKMRAGETEVLKMKINVQNPYYVDGERGMSKLWTEISDAGMPMEPTSITKFLQKGGYDSLMTREISAAAPSGADIFLVFDPQTVVVIA
jgi:SPP1 gp7 family putative phage head morphogenesis protein